MVVGEYRISCEIRRIVMFSRSSLFNSSAVVFRISWRTNRLCLDARCGSITTCSLCASIADICTIPDARSQTTELANFDDNQGHVVGEGTVPPASYAVEDCLPHFGKFSFG